MNTAAYIHLFVKILISLIVISFYLQHLHKQRIQFRKKRIEFLCGLLLFSFFLFGCLPSLHPLYTDDTLVFDEQLIGKWYGDDGGLWTFSKSGEKEYELRIAGEEGKQELLAVHLAAIGSHRYLDLFPGEEPKEKLFPYTWMPVHVFMQVELSDPNLHLEWVVLGKLIEKDPNALKHEIIPETNEELVDYGEYPFLITAPPEDIQRVIMQHAEEIVEDEGAGLLKRCPSIFKEKDILFEKKLLGQWKSENGHVIDFIQSGNNSYDIKFREKDEEQRHFNGILCRLNNRTLMGLFINTPSQHEIDAGLHLIPDYFLLVDYSGNELKSWQLDWEDMEKYRGKDLTYNFDTLKQPDIIFRKNSKELKSDDTIK